MNFNQVNNNSGNVINVPSESIEFDAICLQRAIEISKTGVYGYSMAHVGLEPLLSVVKTRTAEKRGKNDQA